MSPPPRPLVHLELHTGDLEGARSLLHELVGLRPQDVWAGPRPYLALEWGGELGGGVVQCPTPRPVWLPYVEVPCIDRATNPARRIGAAVLLEPREGPAGWRSVVTTPAGGELAFWQPKH